MARLDNIFGSTWLNVKLGKFELDNLLSEKRILTLTGNGGIYQLYHFMPQGDGNIFGQMGDNQLGVEVMGHSFNDRTRYSAALISSNDGQRRIALRRRTLTPDSLPPARHSIPVSWACSASASTPWLAKPQPPGSPTAGRPIAGSGTGNKGYSREGFVGQFYFGQHFDVQVVTQHGSDSAWFGQGYGDFIDNPTGCAAKPNTIRAAVQQRPGHSSPLARATRPGMAFWSNLTTSTVRNSSSSRDMKRSGCRSSRLRNALGSRQYHHLHRRLSLQPVHDEPRWFCLA